MACWRRRLSRLSSRTGAFCRQRASGLCGWSACRLDHLDRANRRRSAVSARRNSRSALPSWSCRARQRTGSSGRLSAWRSARSVRVRARCARSQWAAESLTQPKMPGLFPVHTRKPRTIRSCRRQGLPGLSRRWHPRPSCAPHGSVILDGEAGRGSRRRGEREPRPGCLDAAEARGRAPGRPDCRPCARRPRAIGGDGRQPGLIQRPGLRLAAGPRNVGAAARRVRTLTAVTLSDTGGQGERTRRLSICITYGSLAARN